MVFRRIDKRTLWTIDWALVGATAGLCLIGLTVLNSAGFDPDLGKSGTMERQAVSMALGWGSFLICMMLNPGVWKKLTPFIYVLGIVLLLMLFTKGVVAGGARRWLDFGGFRMQPSEFMKIGVILTMARVLSRERAPRDGYTVKTLLVPLSVLVVPMLLILKEPDLGTSLCHLMIGGSMILVAGIRFGTLLRLVIFALVLTVPAWNFLLKDYQKQRVITFLAPERDPLGSGYHAIQSKIAVGSGAVAGKGHRQGTQTQLRFLPEQTTDFIFSVLAEEWGFVGTIAALSLYLFTVLHLITLAGRFADPFAGFVTVGVAALIFWHVLVNIGMVVGVLPVVGITLVMMSYGGSSIVTAMTLLGIVAGFSIRRYIFA